VLAGALAIRLLQGAGGAAGADGAAEPAADAAAEAAPAAVGASGAAGAPPQAASAREQTVTIARTYLIMGSSGRFSAASKNRGWTQDAQIRQNSSRF
jgi:hypothetical protein